MAPEVKFVGSSLPKSSHSREYDPKYDEFRALLEENPGEWAEWPFDDWTPKTAKSYVSKINRGKFAPLAGCKAAMRNDVLHIQVPFGEQKPTAAALKAEPTADPEAVEDAVEEVEEVEEIEPPKARKAPAKRATRARTVR